MARFLGAGAGSSSKAGRRSGRYPLADFAGVLARLGPSQALTFGIPRTGDGPIFSRALHVERGRPAGATTRTRDSFVWPAGPGIMMLDHDPDEVPLSRDALSS